MEDPPLEMLALQEAYQLFVTAIPGVTRFEIMTYSASVGWVFLIRLEDLDNPPPGLPESIGGYRVIVGQGGRAIATDPRLRNPVVGGAAIGRFKNIASNQVGIGTLGAVVRDVLGGGELCALTCAHCVFPADPADQGLYQPDPDSYPADQGWRLGNVIRYEQPAPMALPVDPTVVTWGLPPIVSIIWGYVDAAIVSISNPARKPVAAGDIWQVGRIAGTASVRRDDWVCKQGAKTGVTYGIVKHTDAAVPIWEQDGSRKWTLVKQISIEGRDGWDSSTIATWSRPGDSGSVVLDRNGNAVGLLTSAVKDEDSFGFVTPIGWVASKLLISFA